MGFATFGMGNLGGMLGGGNTTKEELKTPKGSNINVLLEAIENDEFF